MASAVTFPPSERTSSCESAQHTRTPFEFAAWLIDLDGTLYWPQPVRVVMASQLAMMGRSAIPVIREFRREHERLHDESLPAECNPFELQIERTAKRLDMGRDEVRAIVNQWMLTRPLRWLQLFRRRSLLSRITSFRAQGGKTAVVSDYPASRKLASMGIADQFDAVVAVGESGGPHQLKPNPVGYLLAAAALRVATHDCLVIGDRADVDGEAARRAEMRFLHIASRWPH